MGTCSTVSPSENEILSCHCGISPPLRERTIRLLFVSPVYPHDITIYHNYDWYMFKILNHPCWPKNILSLYCQSYWYILCYITIGCCLKHVRCNLDVCPELMSRNQRIVQRGWLILIPHEDKVDVISPTNILFWGGGKFRSLIVSHEDKVYVVSPFSILVIGGGGFRSLMMIRWYCFLMKITVFKVSFTCHRGLIVPLALLGFATSQQHKIVSVMSQWWVWANVKVADNMSYYMDVSENGI